MQIGSNNNGYLSQDGNISSSGDLNNTQNAGQENSGLNGYKTIGVNITLTETTKGYFWESW